MYENVIVEIDKCELFLEGATIRVPHWRVRKNNTIFFDQMTMVKSTLGELMIPTGTLLVLEGWVEPGNTVKAIRILTRTWSLHEGIHRGTLISRDSDRVDGFESLGAVKAWYESGKDWIRKMGYKCWFAYAIPPEGSGLKQVSIDTSVPYLR